MNTETRAQWDVARWLLTHELGDAPAPASLPAAAERAARKLSQRLTRLVTAEGARALLARALQMARDDYPFLAEIRAGATADAAFDGQWATVEGVEPETMRDALTAVLAGVLGLLVTFIGEALMLRVVRDVWPEAPIREVSQPGEEARR